MRGKRSSLVFSVVLLVAFMGIVAYAVSVTPPNVAKRMVRGEALSPSGPTVPSPGDTIRYDDGSPWWVVWFAGQDVYWVVRFTPAQDCTVKEAHVGVYVWAGAAPTCTLIIWDDNAGVPGTRVYDTTFTAGTSILTLPITQSITFPESTDFWMGYFLKAPDDPGPDTTLAWLDNGLNYGDRSWIDYGGTWYPFDSISGMPGDLIIRAYVEYYSGAANRDVGSDSITSPPDTVRPDSSYIPAAWVHNYGDSNEVFGVECIINPGAYGDTFVVMGLGPGGDIQCVFDQWVVPPGDSTNYTMCVVTLLGVDTNPGNDTLCKDIYAVNPAIHDVGVDSIVSPPDTVQAGMDYSPSAWVTNYGNYTEIFQVFCEIDSAGSSVYADTEAVFNLGPGSSQQVTFMLWTVPPAAGVTYNTCMWVDVTDDVVPANDSLCRLSYSVTGVAERFSAHRPARLALHQNMPNPFSGTTTISYEIPISGRVNLSIYDATGSLVRTLADGEAAPGYYGATWNGRGDSGSLVPDGVYFCKLSVGKTESTAKVVIVR